MTHGHCIETATFRLNPGVTEEELLAAERGVRAGRISTQPGYISRELARDDATGEWLMVMRFDTRQHMDAWMTDLKSAPEMRTLGALIDRGSMVMRFYTHAEP